MSVLQQHSLLSKWNGGGGRTDDKVRLYLLQRRAESEREGEETGKRKERARGNWCFRALIFSVVPHILQQDPGSYNIPPLSHIGRHMHARAHTHTHNRSYSSLWQNTLLPGNIVQHRAALPAFINRTMQAETEADVAATGSATTLVELLLRFWFFFPHEKWFFFYDKHSAENVTGVTEICLKHSECILWAGS